MTATCDLTRWSGRKHLSMSTVTLQSSQLPTIHLQHFLLVCCPVIIHSQSLQTIALHTHRLPKHQQIRQTLTLYHTSNCLQHQFLKATFGIFYFGNNYWGLEIAFLQHGLFQFPSTHQTTGSPVYVSSDSVGYSLLIRTMSKAPNQKEMTSNHNGPGVCSWRTAQDCVMLYINYN